MNETFQYKEMMTDLVEALQLELLCFKEWKADHKTFSSQIPTSWSQVMARELTGYIRILRIHEMWDKAHT